MTSLTRFFIDQTGNSAIQNAVIFALLAIAFIWVKRSVGLSVAGNLASNVGFDALRLVWSF